MTSEWIRVIRKKLYLVLFLRSQGILHLNFKLKFTFFKFLKKSIYVCLGFCRCTHAFSSSREWGLLLVAVLRLLTAGSPPVAEPGFRGLSGCSLWASLLCSTWNRPELGTGPLSPSLANLTHWTTEGLLHFLLKS